MPLRVLNWTSPLFAGLLAILLAGCGGLPPLVTPVADRLQTQAGALEAAGNHAAAAQVYLQAAAAADIPEKYRLQLLAAGSLIRGGEPERAAALLDPLQDAGLTGELRAHYRIRRAALELARQHPDQALLLLQEAPAGPDLRID
jgi:outer membrane PBP1 activator LpoA protein